jgi:ADP-ribosylglycohydrolase
MSPESDTNSLEQEYAAAARTTGRRPRLRILFGAAVGDALGAATEFMDVRDAHTVFPRRPKTYAAQDDLRIKPGYCTDDTQLTVVTLQAFQFYHQGEYADLLQHVRTGLMAWLMSDPPDVGTVVQRSLRHGAFETWRRFPDSGAGNGSLMRAVAINALGLPEEEIVPLSVLVGAVTHVDPLCIWSCLFFNLFVENLLIDMKWSEAIKTTLARINDRQTASQVLELLLTYCIPQEEQVSYQSVFLEASIRVNEAVLKGASGNLRSQGGFVLDTLSAALAHNVKATRFDDCVWRAARHGQDADTTAAIAGVLGAARGWRVPKKWAAPLSIGHTWGNRTLLNGFQNTWPLITCLPQLLDSVEQKREPG